MNDDDPVFLFSKVPRDIDKSSIRVFKDRRETFSLEYAIFDPNTIFIYMNSIQDRNKMRKNTEKRLPVIQQFASSMGLHRVFHEIQTVGINFVLDTLSQSFQVGKDGPKFYSAGFIGIEDSFDFPNTYSENFNDELLEILADQPQFAFFQYLFKPLILSKKKKSKRKKNINNDIPIQFDIQRGRVEQVSLSKSEVEQTLGQYLFSPRIIIVENDPVRLQSKIEQLNILFKANGLRLRQYSSFSNRFSHCLNLCLKRKMKTPITLDGFSLMKFISLPEQQHGEGYSLVPNKSEIKNEDIQQFTELSEIAQN